MVPLRLTRSHETTSPTLGDVEVIAFLNHLRFVSMKCRVKPRTGLFEACALLHAERTASLDAHSEALMRCLNEALGKPAQLYRPGAPERTFDENWLVQLGIACVRDDNASCNFLLCSRVAVENRRLVAFLVGKIAAFFPLS